MVSSGCRKISQSGDILGTSSPTVALDSWSSRGKSNWPETLETQGWLVLVWQECDCVLVVVLSEVLSEVLCEVLCEVLSEVVCVGWVVLCWYYCLRTMW